MTFQPDPSSPLSAILSRHLGREGPLLPILHDVQAAYGMIPDEVLSPIAQALNISRAEVFGVVSFYHDFRTTPAGRHVVKLCRAEACQAKGCEALSQDLCDRLGLEWHHTNAAGITLEPVFCLGLCAMGPAALVDDKLMGRVTADAILAKLEGV